MNKNQNDNKITLKKLLYCLIMVLSLVIHLGLHSYLEQHHPRFYIVGGQYCALIGPTRVVGCITFFIFHCLGMKLAFGQNIFKQKPHKKLSNNPEVQQLQQKIIDISVVTHK